MAGEGFRVQVIGLLQSWRNWVMTVVYRCHAIVFGASADSREEAENWPHCITRGSSDGGTASPSDATSSGEKKWKKISNALTAKSSAPRELQISKNIDPAGEFKVPLALADEASQPTDAAATVPSAQCQTPPPRRSLKDSKEQGIIVTTPKPAIQDVKFGNEVLVVNTSFVNIKPDQIESLNQVHVCNGVDAFYEDQIRKLQLELDLKFGKPELDNAAAAGLPVEAKPFEGPGHVPPSVSEGSVPTFAMHVDKTKTNLGPSLEKRRTAAGKGAEVLANLEQTTPTQKSLPMGIDSNNSLGQGSSSNCFM